MNELRVYASVLIERERSVSPTGPSAFDRLPPEIIAEIFVFCAAVSSDSVARIARVCRSWRNIVYDWPRIWFRLFLDQENRPIRKLQMKAEMWANQSCPLNFDVEIKMAHMDMMLAILSPLLQHIDRWRTFNVRGNWVEHIRMSDLRAQGGVDQLKLERIDIFIDDDLKEEVGNKAYTPKAPTFHFIEGQLGMQFRTSTLPERYFLEPMQITTLVINDNSDVIHPVNLLKLLTVFPKLEKLRVAGWPPFDVYDYTSAPTVSLPHLTELAVRGLFSTRAVLSHLHTPVLKELNLGLLNVDHRLSDEFDYEDGDSEDEAQDYSQSPSSDHATGMGLRSLIKRSRPPLELLYMDYADMRTKDFAWCFERLPTLQTFGIVASDMSDKVIKLLGARRDPLEERFLDHVARFPIRLPSLKTLVLRNCQRLSGEAITDALESRVQFTDRQAPNGAIATLQHVQIQGCDGVRDEHMRILKNILGQRLIS
ncbi:hypothetical protein NEOLEDRAFT_1077648 [Neolentinus lepideus HHB14362 ss-1]|uniref:F-box domain-containing protein n=1 Tax=Neolentinus lepideus HHB14362 ss-1 TaxID=1314782 RepID=A0A165NDR8_9AGAM|nr:hypothetical protein NEOLEDRAFT_1077648 [Neolentinus lepideus HHB14362 ss-1]